jgi:predicted nucleic acid-binding protein
MATSPEQEPAAPPILRALIDTNVILDLLLRREPWVTDAQPLVDAQDVGRVTVYLPTSALTDIFYISRRLVGIDHAFEAVDRCLEDFVIVPVDRALAEAARRLPGNDFEDNVQIACAQAAGLDLIITRDTRDVAGFRHSPIPAIKPAAIVGYLAP